MDSKKLKIFSHKSFGKYLFVYGTLALPLTFYIVFYLFPNVLSVVYSFFYWDGLRDPIFIGFDNYQKLFTDKFFYRALSHNLVIMLVVPVVTIAIALMLSFFLVHGKSKLHSIYQVLFFIPNILSSVVVALLWSFIYDGSFGLLNWILGLFGVDMNGLYWLGNQSTALWAVLPVYIWVHVGFYTVIFSNAIKSIPPSFYEYAILEGASSFQMLRKIVVPMIMGIIRVSALFLVLNTLKAYDMILVLTNGGPDGATDVLGLYMFGMVFNTSGASTSVADYGYASTIGMALFVVLLLSKFLVDKVTKDSEIQY